jgi:hypothetical protein
MLNYYNGYLDNIIKENPFVKELFNQENSKMIFENSKSDIENRIKLEKHKLNEIIKKETTKYFITQIENSFLVNKLYRDGLIKKPDSL